MFVFNCTPETIMSVFVTAGKITLSRWAQLFYQPNPYEFKSFLFVLFCILMHINFEFESCMFIWVENNTQYVCLCVFFIWSPLGLMVRCLMLLGGGFLLCVRYFLPSPVGFSLSPWQSGCRIGCTGFIIGPLPGNFLFFFWDFKETG